MRCIRIKKIVTTLLFTSILFGFVKAQKVTVEGELKQWHKVTLSFEGDNISENDSENPFLNYRLNVTFKNGSKTYTVPGFYAADGNAAETSADAGQVWKVRFRPDQTGEWSYEASFRKGEAIAVNDDVNAGEAVAFDGAKGSFTIAKTDKTGVDFRSKGRLQYVGERYLQFSGNKEYLVKGGAGSPENFLGYYEFDQTPATHKFEPHAKDWKNGDPVWQNGKGKNIIGALNYLAAKGMGSLYFLTMNVQGDGKDVWPWNNVNERYRFDCSKLDQWEIVFDHMDKLGIMLHVMTQETENELLLDLGETKTQRKLYYRELIARFAHHLGVTWNLGEENGYETWSPKAQDDDDRKAMAKYLSTNDPYKNHVALHTHASTKAQIEILEPVLGYQHITGPSLQIHAPKNTHELTKHWIQASEEANHIWVTSLDEIGPANAGAIPDADDPEHFEMRKEVLWGNLMAGGAGVEWYFGYKYAHNDLNCEDLRSRDILWDQTRYALEFFRMHLPYNKMKSADELTKNSEDYVLAKEGSIYTIYLPKIKETKIDLTGVNTSFSVQWYNPRKGGKLQKGTVRKVRGGKIVSIGFPPSKEKDWVALLTTKKPVTVAGISKKNKSVYVLDALKNFEVNSSNNAKAIYYTDTKNGALAIDASNKAFRDEYATAKTVFNGENGKYNLSLVTLTENDGESSYVVKINGKIIGTLVNTTTDASYAMVNHNLGGFFLLKNDVIEIASKAVTNGRIPENDETAWSRGRWKKLIATPVDFSMDKQLASMPAFEEKKGLLKVEGEAFHYKTANNTKRDWKISSKKKAHNTYYKMASGQKYIASLPDTRVTHDDKLIKGENFFPEPGTGGIVSYKVNITTPGKYHIWVRAYSTGTEDNGIHVGIDGEWPESGARMQWCEGKNAWTWSSAQRTEEVHCGVPQKIHLNIKKAGEHLISFAMREDGFRMDQWLMTTDQTYVPE